MAVRPLRQFYDEDLVLDAPDGPEAVIQPWRRHRRRFLAALGDLSAQQWRSTTRCDDWDAIGVVWHLITADQFWVASLAGGAGGRPTSILRGFDPTTSPGAITESSRQDSPGQTLASFGDSTALFERTVDAIDGDAWELTAESPLGHVSARLALAHAFWDSWLHERDILVPLGLGTAPETDELWVTTWYSVLAGAVQGGLPSDDAAIAPGPSAPFTECLSFEEFPDRSLEVTVGEDVAVIQRVTDSAPTVSALALVEYFTGRTADPGSELPPELAAQLERARQIL